MHPALQPHRQSDSDVRPGTSWYFPGSTHQETERFCTVAPNLKKDTLLCGAPGSTGDVSYGASGVCQQQQTEAGKIPLAAVSRNRKTWVCAELV